MIDPGGCVVWGVVDVVCEVVWGEKIYVWTIGVVLLEGVVCWMYCEVGFHGFLGW